MTCKLFNVAFLAVCLVLGVQAQQKAGVKKPDTSTTLPSLVITSSVTSQVFGPNFGRVRCDEDGNVYLRPYSADRGRAGTLHQTPIQKIKPDGSLAGSFRVTDFREGIWGRDFFVTDKGAVYQIVQTAELEMYVLEFSSDGSLKSHTKIDTEFFSPYQLAVFKSGEFLLSGTAGKQGHTPFTAVFSSGGKLLKKLTSPEDEDSQTRAESGDSTVVGENGFGNAAVHFGDAAAGSDGNLYLMRAGSRAWIYAVSPAGEVIRKFFVDSGDSSLQAKSMKSAPGRIAIAFGRKSEVSDNVIKIVDLEGNAIADYVFRDNRLSPAFLSCYVPPVFTFVQANGSGPLIFQNAEPK